MVPFGAAPTTHPARSRVIASQAPGHIAFSSPLHELEVPLPCHDVLDLFALAVDAQPLATAVRWPDGEASYQDLDQRSNQVCRSLVASGSEPGAIVAVVVDDPLERIVAILGCLKAGCVFAPIDPGSPPQRIRQMLQAVRMPWAIVDRSAGAAFCALVEDEPITLVSTQSGRPAVGASGKELAAIQARDHGDDALRVRRGPDDACYLYFTSGSTGTPKAILGRIRGLAHFIQWEIGAFGLGPGFRVSQLTGPAFDVYLRDVFAPLCSGGTVCVPPPGVGRDPLALGRWLDAERIGLVHCVPSLFRLLLQQELAPDRFASLRYVLLAGEALPAADANRWISRFGARARLVNLYGPTETTLAKFFHLLPAEPIEADFVPIGRPIPGAQALLLDERMTPCAVDELGELYIRTPYRSLGYLDADASAAFMPNPFTGSNEDLIYRTGDLAKMLPDGNFRYCGRRDFQVKIRGVRVEPGEVEARMLEHPGVREAVVIGAPDGFGEMRLVAYYVPVAGPVPSSSLRQFLAQRLPEAMMPAVTRVLERFPLSPNGKLDRRALPSPGNSRPELAAPYEPATNAQERSLCAAFGETVGVEPIGRNDNFFELGGNSLLAARLLAKLQQGTVRALPATILFGNPTPASLASALANEAGARVSTRRLATAHRETPGGSSRGVNAGREAIAIVGMAGRFPGAADVEQFWENLCAGRESITRFRPDEIDPSVAATDRLDPGYVRARGIIDDVELFDAGFFGINPREAELMDPQHRIFLELCWECMERAGEVPDAASVPVGVFAGTYHSTYLRRHVAAHPDRVAQVGQYLVTLANEKDYLATRVANKLNLTGPAISLYTACSTSLVAVCQALDSLRAGRCDMALAGGISITCPPRSGYIHQEGAMFSPDGHTRTFDARAQGTVFSDGAGVVLLKRLSDAVRDGNPIHALVIGAAVNNDGGEKASFTAPSSDAQAAVIAMAQDDARVSPRSIGYVEAHGTATPMGDPIEMEGLRDAFGRGTSDVGFCRIGSVKSNIGHLVIAAGAAGMIKTAMALSKRKIPASLHFEDGNPAIDFANSPFQVNAQLSDWAGDSAPLRAGVSSFGVGGTNAHVILEQAPALPDSEASEGPHLLVLSARSPAALERAASRLADALEAQRNPDAGNPPELADVAWTLATGRKAFAHRLSLVCAGVDEAIDKLRAPALATSIERSPTARACQPVFLFPGQGSHYVGMGRALCATEPVFRAAIEECHEALFSANGLDLQGLLASEDPAALLPTAVMQPTIFSVEYALARLWMDRGVQPSAMIGHSVGEFVAATLAGTFSLADALTLVERRGALMQEQPAGSMLSVMLPWDELLARLPPELSLAAENAPGCCVVSGPTSILAEWQRQLDGEGVACRGLRTSHAFHSAMMDPVVEPFRKLVAAATRSGPSIPIVSGSSGDWLDAATAISPDYWARHLRNPVRFASALARVLTEPGQVLLEVGPRSTLCSLARLHPLAQSTQAITIASLSDSVGSEVESLLGGAGRLWCAGVAVDPAAFDRRERRRRLLLPTYPFERQRFWVEAAAESTAPQPAAVPNVQESPMDEKPQAPGAALAADTAAPDARQARPAETTALDRLLELLRGTTGLAWTEDDHRRSFVELGLDSLVLTQISRQLQRKLDTQVSFRQLMGEYSTVERLATLLAPAPAPVATAAQVPTAANTGSAQASAATRPASRLTRPDIAGARLGRDPDGMPAWFVPHPELPGKFLRIES